MKNNKTINKDLFYNCNDVCSFIESLPAWTTDKQKDRLLKMFSCYRPKNKK